MGSIHDFLTHLDLEGLMMALMSAAAALICLTVHECCHGLAAYRLGDPTAKEMGRLTLNPIRHIDPIGLVLMITAHVGWAKPVPVDMRYFKHPKRDMALTALAGPASNFLLAWVFLLLANGFLYLLPILPDGWSFEVCYFVFLFLASAAQLSVGLGVFNLIPIPPLDGSRILFAFLPDKLYIAVMRYERYIMVALLALVWLGVLDGPLGFLIRLVLRGLCLLSGFPAELFM